jgi:PadR family transcriptional regulator, regulatory protein PadR
VEDKTADAHVLLAILYGSIYAEMSKLEVSMPSPRFPIPQGTLDMLILQILSLEPSHGYGIAQRLEQISRAVVQVNQGSLYPALHRLEQKGWLRAEWKPSETGREAKVYSLTRSGRTQLGVEKDSWMRLTDAVQLIFKENTRT